MALRAEAGPIRRKDAASDFDVRCALSVCHRFRGSVVRSRLWPIVSKYIPRAPVFPWFARLVLRRLKTGTDAAVLADRGVEDVVPAELGLGCLAEKAAAEGLFFPEHRTFFGFDSVRIGTLMGHSAQASVKLLDFLAPTGPWYGTRSRPDIS